MPRLFDNQAIFPFPFPQTALGVMHKYPNPHADHVVSMDTLDQSIDAGTGRIRLERILGVRQGAPGWAVKLLGGTEDTYVREIVMIDPFTGQVEMTSTNLSLSKYMLVREYITYRPTPASPHATTFAQRASIECGGLSGPLLSSAARKVEEWSFQRFGANAQKGYNGLLAVLEALWGPPRAG